jgi:hypothetical protein
MHWICASHAGFIHDHYQYSSAGEENLHKFNNLLLNMHIDVKRCIAELFFFNVMYTVQLPTFNQKTVGDSVFE